MLLLLFIIVVGCGVQCDEIRSNYYVIEMPDSNPMLRSTKKTFNVYWNVPTKQCESRKIIFKNLYEDYGVIQNKGDSFRGEKITILYDPGLFPALFKNANGDLKYRNGGVPQEGNLDEHLNAFSKDLDISIPDPQFDGVGIIDFESWRPVFRQNFGTLTLYQEVSIEIEKKKHWWWRKEWLKAEAKSRFEDAARLFMQRTLALAKKLRPKAKWGYYGFPYCFNMANNHMDKNCAKGVSKENDQIFWLWEESTALFPSVYSPKSLAPSQLAELITGRVNEASRVRKQGTIILPYFWYRYRDGGYLREDDLNVALKSFYSTKTAGFIIWGSSNDVNTLDRCTKLHKNLETILGPAIAKYTKQSRLQDEMVDDFYTYNETNISVDSINNTSNSSIENHNDLSSNHTNKEIIDRTDKTNQFSAVIKDDQKFNYSILVGMILNTANNSTLKQETNGDHDEIIKDENEDFMSPEEAALYDKAYDDLTSLKKPEFNIISSTVPNVTSDTTIDTTTYKSKETIASSEHLINSTLRVINPDTIKNVENDTYVNEKSFFNNEEYLIPQLNTTISQSSFITTTESGKYYIPETTDEEAKKPYNVYWNVPTIQCAAKKIVFDKLFENYGIIQNAHDSFRGEKITILYDPGQFPALFKSADGDLKFRNGGVPQEGSLDEHLSAFSKDLNISIPDQLFDGIAIIDFESWRPIFIQNFGTLSLYQNVSIEIERMKHWWWKEDWLKAEAKSRFEEAARNFMLKTLLLAKKLRPKAKWGYYGFPYCFNKGTNQMNKNCAKGVPKENDRISWLWEESTALFPSVYSSNSLTSSQLAELITGRVNEASRVRKGGTLILPYFWYRYRDGGFLSKEDLNMALKSFYQTNSSGFIIWGSSNDVKTIDKCINLHMNLETMLGPAIAKYTKNNSRLQNETYDLKRTSVISFIDNSLNTTTIATISKNFNSENANKTKINITEKIYQTSTENSLGTTSQETKDNLLLDIILYQLTKNFSNQYINRTRDEIVKNENEDFIMSLEEDTKANDSEASVTFGLNVLSTTAARDIDIASSNSDTTTHKGILDFSKQFDTGLTEKQVNVITNNVDNRNNTEKYLYIDNKNSLNTDEQIAQASSIIPQTKFSSDPEVDHYSERAEMVTFSYSEDISETSTKPYIIRNQSTENYIDNNETSLHSSGEYLLPLSSSTKAETSLVKASTKLRYDYEDEAQANFEKTNSTKIKITDKISAETSTEKDKIIRNNAEHQDINKKSLYKIETYLNTETVQTNRYDTTTKNFEIAEINKTIDDIVTQVDEPSTEDANTEKILVNPKKHLQLNITLPLESSTIVSSISETEFNSNEAKTNIDSTEITVTTEEYIAETSTEEIILNTNIPESDSYTNKNKLSNIEENIYLNTPVILFNWVTSNSETENYSNLNKAETKDLSESTELSKEYFKETSHTIENFDTYNTPSTLDSTESTISSIKQYFKPKLSTEVPQLNSTMATSDTEYNYNNNIFKTNNKNIVSTKIPDTSTSAQEFSTNNKENYSQSSEKSLYNSNENYSSEFNTTVLQISYTTPTSEIDIEFKNKSNKVYIDNDEIQTYETENIQVTKLSTNSPKLNNTEAAELDKYETTTVIEVQNGGEEVTDTLTQSTNDREYVIENTDATDTGVVDDSIFIEDNEFNSTSLIIPSMNSSSQVATSATQLVLRHKYLSCIFFFLYTVSKCLCDIYEVCS